MDVALREQLGFCSTYIDDVIVYSCTSEQHLEFYRCCAQCLESNWSDSKPKKCVWGVTFLEYLGQEVGLGKVGVP